MKHIRKTLAALPLLALSALAFYACNKDDDPGEEVELDVFDDLSYFQNSIVDVDSLGTFRYYAYGEPIYENDPEHLYVGVDDIDEAAAIFRQWLAPDVTVTESGGKLSCALTDEGGKAQGTVYFTPGEGANVAEVTASSDTRLLHFSRLTFLLNSAWPFNSAASRWHKFDIIKNVTPKGIKGHLPSEDKILNWVCIRESGNGVKPMFCAVTTNNGMNCNSHDHTEVMTSKYCPGLEKAKNIGDILQKDWDLFKAVFHEAGGDVSYDCWIDHTHSNFWKYWDYIYYGSNKVYGRKSWGDGSVWLLKIDWIDDDQMYDGASI